MKARRRRRAVICLSSASYCYGGVISDPSPLFVDLAMSKTAPPALIPFSPSSHATFEASLKEYEKKTEESLLIHPLMARLQGCKSPADILVVLRSHVPQFENTTSADGRLTKWLDPIVNVLSASSSAISAGVGVVSPIQMILLRFNLRLYLGIPTRKRRFRWCRCPPFSNYHPGLPLSERSDTDFIKVAKDVIASHDALIIIFEQIETFFKPLQEHAAVPMTEAMSDIMVKIMAEVLEICAIITEEIKQGQSRESIRDDMFRIADTGSETYFREFSNELIGRKAIKDALSRLGRLTQEAAKAATVILEERRRRVWTNKAWLSPPDPSTNLNIARKAQHQGTATWFFEGNISTEWKFKSTAPLLWIHGIRAAFVLFYPQILILRTIIAGSGKSVLWSVVIYHVHPRGLTPPTSSAIIQDIMALQEAGQATIAYFYFDFRDLRKQVLHDALISLLSQLSACSDSYCDILFHLNQAHDDGGRRPSTKTMITCLKEMLALPDQLPVYIILDALDECPDTKGFPSSRYEVLDCLKDLVGLQLPNLHICVTSRPEIDIRSVLEPLASYSISIQDQSGQKADIADYIRSSVNSSPSMAMRRWRADDKNMVIETLSERVDGM